MSGSHKKSGLVRTSCCTKCSQSGCDDLEPGAGTNDERVKAMSFLHGIGVKTWASIEPIIDPQNSLDMIAKTIGCCDHFKIGILSGQKNYTPDQIRNFKAAVDVLNLKSVYWKESLLEYI